MAKSDSAALDLMPDERVIYRGKAGRFSFFRFLPASSIVATNKRFFVLSPLSKKRSFFYDNIGSIRRTKGLLNSKFIISSIGEGNGDFKTAVTFYSNGHAMAFFNVLSNQIYANRDPYHGNKEVAHTLDSTYKILSKNGAYTHPAVDLGLNASRYARAETAATKKVQKTLTVESEIQQPEMPDAKRVQEIIPNTTQLGTGLPTFTQKLNKSLKTLNPKNTTVGYFAAGLELKPTSTVEVANESTMIVKASKDQAPKTEQEKDFDPDADLKIFSIRRMKGVNIKGNTSGKKRVNPFNIPSAK